MFISKLQSKLKLDDWKTDNKIRKFFIYQSKLYKFSFFETNVFKNKNTQEKTRKKKLKPLNKFGFDNSKMNKPEVEKYPKRDQPNYKHLLDGLCFYGI